MTDNDVFSYFVKINQYIIIKNQILNLFTTDEKKETLDIQTVLIDDNLIEIVLTQSFSSQRTN